MITPAVGHHMDIVGRSGVVIFKFMIKIHFLNLNHTIKHQDLAKKVVKIEKLQYPTIVGLES